MGLTIHYTITPRQPIPATEARRIVTASHAATARLVRRRDQAQLSELLEADPDDPWIQGRIFRKVDAFTTCGYDVPPLRGTTFCLDSGRDCETARFGLCEYPATLRLKDGRRLRTGIAGWRFQAFCKTQYAGLHGWQPFFASHKLVIDAALVWQKLGCDVQLTDEGEYWPGQNIKTLRASLDRYNRIVAGLGGALKDAADAGGPRVESPIFAHPRFEYLEAEGQATHDAAIRQTIATITCT
jgi:hypothetical protein